MRVKWISSERNERVILIESFLLRGIVFNAALYYFNSECTPFIITTRGMKLNVCLFWRVISVVMMETLCWKLKRLVNLNSYFKFSCALGFRYFFKRTTNIPCFKTVNKKNCGDEIIFSLIKILNVFYISLVILYTSNMLLSSIKMICLWTTAVQKF